MKKAEAEEFLRRKKLEGQLIDPETAEFHWGWGQELDPYGIHDLPSELDCIGRVYFARSPGSDSWVEFGELPNETRSRLEDRLAQGELTEDWWPVGRWPGGR